MRLERSSHAAKILLRYSKGTSGCDPERSGTTMISYSRRGPNTSGMQLAELFYPDDTAKIQLARQVGITHAFYSLPTVLARVPRSEYVRELKRVQADLESADLIFAGVESHP